MPFFNLFTHPIISYSFKLFKILQILPIFYEYFKLSNFLNFSFNKQKTYSIKCKFGLYGGVNIVNMPKFAKYDFINLF